ncbi:hypothetical protein D3C85_1734930 [compost metagenome]
MNLLPTSVCSTALAASAVSDAPCFASSAAIQSACLCSGCPLSASVSRLISASPVSSLAMLASSSCRRPGSTASPITSIKPMFSFLMWCKC